MATAQGRRKHHSDPGEGTLGTQRQSKWTRVEGPSPQTHPKSSQAYKTEQRQHRAIERAIQEAQKRARFPPRLEPAPALATVSPALAHQSASQPLPQASLSPDVLDQGATSTSAEAAILFATLPADSLQQAPSIQMDSQFNLPASMAPLVPTSRSADLQDPQITPALASLISEGIWHGIAQGLQQRSALEVSEYVSQVSRSHCSRQLEESGGAGETRFSSFR